MALAILALSSLLASLFVFLAWQWFRHSRGRQSTQSRLSERGAGWTVEKDPYENIEPLVDFDWAATPPIRNAPLKPKYYLTMALEQISFSELIAMDNTYLDRLRFRRETMAAHPDATLQCNTVCEPAVHELYDYLFGTYLPRRFPSIYTLSASGAELLNTATNETISLSPHLPVPPSSSSAPEALRTLGAHIDTDFLLLLPSSTTADGSPIYHLEAFVTCCPSGFSTREKLGLPLARIHAPVPGYSSKLERSMDRFFAKLECGRVVKRSNWAVTTDSRLFAERGNHLYVDQGGDVERQRRELVVGECRLRSERQTLFRLPRTKALVFGFKTYQYTLEDVKREGYGEELVRAMEGLREGNVPEMDFYKKGVVWREGVIEFLRS